MTLARFEYIPLLVSGGAKHRGLGCDDPHPIPASTRQSSAFDRSSKVDKGDTTL